MIEITEGHVTARREGDNLYLKCNACGYEETVINYEGGKQPCFIVWFPIRMNGTVYVKCEKCGKLHERVIPYAN